MYVLKMHLLILASIVLVILLSPNMVTGQSQTVWEPDERCLVEPETPPENWTYDGTLLLLSPQGVHGFNTEWETRRILAYEPQNTIHIIADSISPDGRTWITTQGDSWCTGSCNVSSVTISNMTIHDLTAPTPTSYSLEWNFYTPNHWKENLEGQGIPILRWLSPSQFIYVNDLDGIYQGDGELPVLFDTLTQDIQPYDLSLESLSTDEFHRISSDETREIVTRYDNDRHASFVLMDVQAGEEILTFPENVYPLHNYSTEAWSPDSQYFLGYSYTEDLTLNIWLFDRNGQLIGNVIQIQDDAQILLYGFRASNQVYIDWSPDGHYLSLSAQWNLDESIIPLMLADLQQQRVIDLCISSIGGAFWSYDSQQLAFQIRSGGDVTILDTTEWNWYLAEENSGAWLTGWQQPD